VIEKMLSGKDSVTSDISKQRESVSDAVRSKTWLHAVPLLMFTSEACQILDYQFP
jgi:hypothetical protein